MTLYTEQSKNTQKTWLLMACFFAVLVALGYFLSQYYGNANLFTVAIFVSVILNVGSYWYSDKIVLKLSHARLVTKSEFPDLWNVAENLSITAGLPMPKLYVIEDSAPNAFATGRNKDHSAVAVTTGLIAMLDRSELDGVVAHELAHIGNRDILLMSVVAVLVGCIALAGDFFLRGQIFGTGGRDRNNGGGNQVMVIVSIVFIILSPIIATIIKLAISRRREFLADATGALLTRYPEGLASALRKISAHGKPLQHAHSATAHMFITNPLADHDENGKEKVNFFAKLFMTHPPVDERVAALQLKS